MAKTGEIARGSRRRAGHLPARYNINTPRCPMARFFVRARTHFFSVVACCVRSPPLHSLTNVGCSCSTASARLLAGARALHACCRALARRNYSCLYTRSRRQCNLL